MSSYMCLGKDGKKHQHWDPAADNQYSGRNTTHKTTIHQTITFRPFHVVTCIFHVTQCYVQNLVHYKCVHMFSNSFLIVSRTVRSQTCYFPRNCQGICTNVRGINVHAQWKLKAFIIQWNPNSEKYHQLETSQIYLADDS